jgi:hypothetical protein
MCTMPVRTRRATARPRVAFSVMIPKIRWRIEHDYRELKHGLGLDHFEGRSWNGWHHHATLVTATHVFHTEQRRAPKADARDSPSTRSLTLDLHHRQALAASVPALLEMARLAAQPPNSRRHRFPLTQKEPRHDHPACLPPGTHPDPCVR